MPVHGVARSDPVRASGGVSAYANRSRLVVPMKHGLLQRYTEVYQKRYSELFGDDCSFQSLRYPALEDSFVARETVRRDSMIQPITVEPTPKVSIQGAETFAVDEEGPEFGLPFDDEELVPDWISATLEKVRRGNGTDGSIVREAIDGISLSALHESPLEALSRTSGGINKPTLDALHEIRGRVWAEISRWYSDARGPKTRQRDDARRRLIGLGKMLAGDARGRRRRRSVHPAAIKELYYRLLFRLIRALISIGKTAKQTHRPVSASRSAIPRMASACGLPEAYLREYLRIENDEVVRPDRPEYQARIWVARAYGLNAQRVANVLATKQSRSRK